MPFIEATGRVSFLPAPAASQVLSFEAPLAEGEPVETLATYGPFSNEASMTIPSSGSASVYPSTIVVSGVPGDVTKVTVVINGFSHTFPEDVDILLVGPGGETVLLMSDQGGSVDAVNAVLTFDDTGPYIGGALGTVETGTFQPSNAGGGDTFASPAPSGPYGSTLAVFNGTAPDGSWKLFVVDAFSGDGGSISGGWSISIETLALIPGEPEQQGVFADQELTIDRLAVQAMQGVSFNGKPLEVSFEVYVDGVMVSRNLLESVSVQESLSQDLQGWSFRVPIPQASEGAAWVFGSPWQAWGCGLARKDVTIKAAIRRGTQVTRYPLITDGVATEEDPGGEPIGGWSEGFAGYDSGARLEGLVTLTLPVGHGLTRDQLQRAILSQAGASRFKLQRGRQLLKPQVFIDQEAVRAAREVGEPEGRVLQVDRDGFWTNPVVGEWGSAPISGTITAFEILGGEDATKAGPPVRVRVCRDPYTDVEFTTYEVLPRTPEEACGREFHPARSTIAGSFTPRVAAFVQNAPSGSLSSSGLTQGPPKPETPIQRTVIERETRCGIVVRESKRVYGWMWPETARYVVAGGEIAPRAGVYLGADATELGGEPAHEGAVEKWTLLQLEETLHFWAKPGYSGPQDLGKPWQDHFNTGGAGGPAADGRYLGSVTTISGYVHPRAGLKDRMGVENTPFEDIDLITGRLVLGNGTGVEVATEAFQIREREIRTQIGRWATTDHSGGLLLDSATVYHEGYAAKPGQLFQYADGRNYAEEVESFQLLGYEVEQYLDVDGSYEKVVQPVDLITGETLPAQFEDLDGLPTVERIPNPSEIDPALYDSPEEAEAARSVDGGRQTVKRRVWDPDLESVHGKRQLRAELPGAEDEQDLAAAALGTIQRSAYMAINFQTLLAVAPRLGQWWRIWYPPLGIDIVGQVHSLTHEGPQGIRAARVTSWEVRAYPEVR